MANTRTLFVGDVHACAQELRELLTLARPSRVVLLGDVFNKGPDPAGTWEIVQSSGAEAVLGNHDVVVLEKADDRLCPKAARRWLATLPLSLEGEGWLAVHAGVDPVKGLQGTSREQLLTMRRWDAPNGARPYWWERWTGPPLVVYGHDAVRGLNDRRPHSLGLDSGCVYGGALSGFLLEEGRILQVPARRAYRSVR